MTDDLDPKALDAAPERLTVYPHGAGRTWSTEVIDEWKRTMAVEYVRADLAALPVPDRGEMVEREAALFVIEVMLRETGRPQASAEAAAAELLANAERVFRTRAALGPATDQEREGTA